MYFYLTLNVIALIFFFNFDISYFVQKFNISAVHMFIY